MTNFKERLQVELEELTTKHDALKGFIKINPVFPTLELRDRVLLKKQEIIMSLYIKTLTERVSRL